MRVHICRSLENYGVSAGTVPLPVDVNDSVKLYSSITTPQTECCRLYFTYYLLIFWATFSTVIRTSLLSVVSVKRR